MIDIHFEQRQLPTIVVVSSTIVVHTMKIIVIPPHPKASMSQVFNHGHGGVQQNRNVPFWLISLGSYK